MNALQFWLQDNIFLDAGFSDAQIAVEKKKLQKQVEIANEDLVHAKMDIEKNLKTIGLLTEENKQLIAENRQLPVLRAENKQLEAKVRKLELDLKRKGSFCSNILG